MRALRPGRLQPQALELRLGRGDADIALANTSAQLVDARLELAHLPAQ